MNAWFFSKDGKQEGPVSAAQIAALAQASALSPDTFVWKEGLADWIPLSQSTILAEARSLPAPAVAPVRSVAPVTPYSVSPTTLAASRANRPDMPLEYPGIGRLGYFIGSTVLTLVFYAILFVVVFAAFKSGGNGGGIAVIGLLAFVVFFGGFLFLAVKRVLNLGMSGWAVLWCLVPFMNIWIGWRMIACPAGYEDHRTLDTAGKIITGLWIGFTVLAVLAQFIAAFAGR